MSYKVKQAVGLFVTLILMVGTLSMMGACTGATTDNESPESIEESEEAIEQEDSSQETPEVEEAPVEEEETSPETVMPPAIPHTLEGRDNCTGCHGEGGIKPFPADHVGRSNDTCQGCHQPE